MPWEVDFTAIRQVIRCRSFEDPIHRQEVAQILDIEVDCIPKSKSWSYDQILSGIDSGHIRGLWVIGTNLPTHGSNAFNCKSDYDSLIGW